MFFIIKFVYFFNEVQLSNLISWIMLLVLSLKTHCHPEVMWILFYVSIRNVSAFNLSFRSMIPFELILCEV